MKCLIAGGAGFIGSHIAEKLLAAGHSVTVLDGFMPRTSGNQGNLLGIADSIQLIPVPVEKFADLKVIVAGMDVIIDSMGWTCHRLALADPLYDVALNVQSHLHLLQAIESGSSKRFIYLGSRGQYGNPKVASVDENTPMVPEDVQGINKLGAESFVRIFSKLKKMPAISLRFGNCFGPRQPVHGDDIGLVGSFIRDLIADREVELFGEKRKRSIIYVEDVAEAVLRCAELPDVNGFDAFNIAGHDIALEGLLACIIEFAQKGSYKIREFPEEIKIIDVGNAEFCGKKLNERLGGIIPSPVESSLKKTVKYFQEAFS